MAREDWEREIDDALKSEGWSLSGPNSLVKVLPLGSPTASTVSGYVAVAKALINKSPPEIEQDLGLPPGYLSPGASIYRLLRLPMAHEFDYELTAEHPGGLVFNPAHSHPSYPPGSKKIHQWSIKAQIPATKLLDLQPSQKFPYPK